MLLFLYCLQLGVMLYMAIMFKLMSGEMPYIKLIYFIPLWGLFKFILNYLNDIK